MRRGPTSVSQEDYLKVIWEIVQEGQTPISARLAEDLGVTPPAVTAALKRMARAGYLRVLRDGPRTSGEIADRFPTAWATVSRHLSQLRDAGLIISERRGQQIVYELNTTVFDDLIEHMLEWVKPTRKPGKRGGHRHA